MSWDVSCRVWNNDDFQVLQAIHHVHLNNLIAQEMLEVQINMSVVLQIVKTW